MNKSKTTTKIGKKVKTTKTTKDSSTSFKYKTIAKGVQQTSDTTYRVRKTTNGTYKSWTFTNKAKAISFYKSLNK
jgi:hypothetical protein